MDEGGAILEDQVGCGRRIRCTCERAHRGAELDGVGEAAEGELTHQIPWLRVFVEGVVIVGKVEY